MSLVRKSNPFFPSMLTGNLDSSWFDMGGFQEPKKDIAVNILENETNYRIEMAVPGFKKEDINVEVKANKLKVSAERSESLEEKQESFTRKEFSVTSFEKSFTLPKQLGVEDIEGSCENGILTLVLKKPVKVEPEVKKITLK